jgi:hypothetical protein
MIELNPWNYKDRIHGMLCPMEQTTRDVITMTTALATAALMTYTLYLSASEIPSFKACAKLTFTIICLNCVAMTCNHLIIGFLRHCPKA